MTQKLAHTCLKTMGVTRSLAQKRGPPWSSCIASYTCAHVSSFCPLHHPLLEVWVPVLELVVGQQYLPGCRHFPPTLWLNTAILANMIQTPKCLCPPLPTQCPRPGLFRLFARGIADSPLLLQMPPVPNGLFSWTQSMNVMHLKSKVRDHTHGTQLDQLQTAPPKSTVQ